MASVLFCIEDWSVVECCERKARRRIAIVMAVGTLQLTWNRGESAQFSRSKKFRCSALKKWSV